MPRLKPDGRYGVYDERLAFWAAFAVTLCDRIPNREGRTTARLVALELPRYVAHDRFTDKGEGVAVFTCEQIGESLGYARRQTISKALGRLEEVGAIRRTERGQRGRPSAYVLVGYEPLIDSNVDTE